MCLKKPKPKNHVNLVHTIWFAALAAVLLIILFKIVYNITIYFIKELLPIAKKLVKLGFDLLGTKGTSTFLKKNNIPIKTINKISEGSPHVVDLLESKKKSLVINTTEDKASTGDSYIMRRNTLLTNTPYYTTIKGADAAIKSIEILKKSNFMVRSLQSIH